MQVLLSLIFIWHLLNPDDFVHGDEIFIRKCNQSSSLECPLKGSVINVPLQNTTTFQLKGTNNSISSISVAQLELINLWKKFPLLITANVSGLSEKCQKSTVRFLNAAQNHELWALKILDATAKLPPGILSGNVNQFGDFDECLSVREAQYCLAEISLEPVLNQDYLLYRNLVHSHTPFKGSFIDPQHRVPDFSSIKWGFCFPSECSPRDLQQSLEENFGVIATVRPSMCKKAVSSQSAWTFGDYAARLFFVLLLLALTISSFSVHYKVSFLINSETKLAKLLLAFSVQNNWKQLTDFGKECDDNNNNANKTNKIGEIRAVHGIRALSAIALLMCHKSVALMFNPYINRTHAMENFSMPWTVIARTAIVYTDSFMILSALLTANSMFRDLEKYGSMKFLDKLITRIFRILPNITTLILFCSYILPSINSGPLWPIVIQQHSNLCKQYMWRNFLFIHNYFGFENMCLTHTHQVGIDMQLFIFTPFFIYALWKNNEFGIYLVAVVAALSTLLRFWATMYNYLSHMIYFGISIKQMFDTANLSYILPTHRASIYVMGIILAYILKRETFNFSKIQVFLWWMSALCLGAVAILGPFHMAKLNYVYNSIDAAIFGAFSPLWWGFTLSWVIYASNNGYAGWFGDFLSWRGFRSFTKIAYAFYLVQFPIIFYNVGIQKNSDEFRLNILLDYTETSVIILLSIILTLFVEIPFQNIKRILFDSDKSKCIHRKLQENTNYKYILNNNSKEE